MKPDAPLKVRIKNGKLSITIGVETLASTMGKLRKINICNPEEFANDVVIELNKEILFPHKPDTLVGNMLEEASNRVIHRYVNEMSKIEVPGEKAEPFIITDLREALQEKINR